MICSMATGRWARLAGIGMPLGSRKGNDALARPGRLGGFRQEDAFAPMMGIAQPVDAGVVAVGHPSVGQVVRPEQFRFS